MSVDENKQLARRLIEDVASNADMAAADDILSPDCVDRNPPAFLAERKGIDSVKELGRLFHRAFPDEHYQIESMVAEGDSVAYQWTGQATHNGEFQGIAPTGKRVTMRGATFIRIRDGKVVEIETFSDALGLLQQIGALPSR